MTVTIKGGSFRGLRFSADGSRIWTNRLESWSAASGKKLDDAPLAKQKGPYAIDVSPDGKRMLIVHQRSGQTFLWNQEQRPEQRALPEKGPVRFARFIGKGERFASLLSSPPSVLVGNVESNQDDMVLALPFASYRGDFSQNGRLLALSKAGDVALWDLALKKQRLVLQHDHDVFSVAISPDERLVATGARDNIVRLFDATEGGTVASMEGHRSGTIFLPAAVYSLAFSPNSKLLASGGHDGRVIVWDVKSRKPLLKAQVTSHPIILSVAFSPDSKLVTGGFEGAGAINGVCVWKVPSSG